MRLDVIQHLVTRFQCSAYHSKARKCVLSINFQSLLGKLDRMPSGILDFATSTSAALVPRAAMGAPEKRGAAAEREPSQSARERKRPRGWGDAPGRPLGGEVSRADCAALQCAPRGLRRLRADSPAPLYRDRGSRRFGFVSQGVCVCVYRLSISSCVLQKWQNNPL